MQSIALVPRDLTIDIDELALVASAIQIQLRDFAKAWNVDASIVPRHNPETIPDGYWCVYICKDANGHDGVHYAGDNGKPFALVQYSKHMAWSIVASHEVLEMLVDPRATYLVPGQSPRNPTVQAQFLVEVCDPCQAIACGYNIDASHDVLVSDFCLPAFYGIGGVRSGDYTFMKSINAPLDIAENGYLTWYEENAGWYQLRDFGKRSIVGPVDKDEILGMIGNRHNLRGAIDRHATFHRKHLDVDPMYSALSENRKHIMSEKSRGVTQRRKVELTHLDDLLSNKKS